MTMNDAVSLPPQPDQPEDAPVPLADEFMARAGRRELAVARCRRTGTALSYAAHRRPGEVQWQTAGGRARLHSFTVLWQAYRAEAKLPYNVAWVELDEGPRLISTVAVADVRDLRIGMPLRARFEPGGRLVFDPDSAAFDADPAAFDARPPVER
ncbi:MAG: Zn-ribbon domain-containing OB-fold protein [Burkholderiaceae bacterium]